MIEPVDNAERVHPTSGSYPGGRNEAGISGDPAVPACMSRYPVQSVAVRATKGFDSPIAFTATLVTLLDFHRAIIEAQSE